MGIVITHKEVADDDLRRSLMFYLLGFGIYLSIWMLLLDDLTTGLAADPTTIEDAPTRRWVYEMLGVISFCIIVLSQVWYLKLKHSHLRRESFRKAISGFPVEMLLLAWIAVSLLSFVLYTFLGERTPTPVLIPSVSVRYVLVITPVYYLTILWWNTADIETIPRRVFSLLLGSVILLPVPILVGFATIKALQFASLVS